MASIIFAALNTPMTISNGLASELDKQANNHWTNDSVE